MDVLGCSIRFGFPVCKLAELDLEPWLKAGNPVARVIEAHRVAQRTARSGLGESRRKGKLELVRSLLRSGAAIEEVADVLRLMNWLLALPEEEELIFREELGRLQKETRMPYISTYDRLVRAEGVAEGRQEGRRAALREAVAEGFKERFGAMPEGLLRRLESIEDEAELRRLVRQVCVAGSAREFEERM